MLMINHNLEDIQSVEFTEDDLNSAAAAGAGADNCSFRAAAGDDDNDNSNISDSDTSGVGEHDDYEPKEKPIARRETRAVTKWKLVVLLVLLCSALGVALCTFGYIRKNEETKFQDDFQSSAHKVLEAIGKSLEKTLKGLDSLSVAVVSHARATNQTWPLVHMYVQCYLLS